jgi:hypothetical protein
VSEEPESSFLIPAFKVFLQGAALTPQSQAMLLFRSSKTERSARNLSKQFRVWVMMRVFPV